LARKILLADDSVTAQNMGRKILTDAGYDVVTVNNGSAALKRITELKPDLIVLDVYMPGYSGLEVCQRLKDAAETARIPVLLTVGKLEPFKPEEARRVRADAHIVKPFEASELLTAIARLEDRMGAQRAGETEAVTDDGWMSRLSFPSKKKKNGEAEEGTTGAAFRDFRKGKGKEDAAELTVKAAPAVQEASRVAEIPPAKPIDLPAALPVDIPRDITPEELDVLSALAAKLNARAEDSATPAKTETPAPVVEGADRTAAAVEGLGVEGTGLAGPALDGPALEDARVEEPVVTGKTEFEVPVQSVEPPVEGAPVVTVNAAGLAEQPAPVDREDEPIFASALGVVEHTEDGLADKAVADKAVEAAQPAASDTELADALRLLTPATEPGATQGIAPAEEGAVAGRWMAEPVALSPEEAAISLEAEMFRTFAAMPEALALTEARSAVASEAPVEEVVSAEVASSPMSGVSAIAAAVENRLAEAELAACSPTPATGTENCGREIFADTTAGEASAQVAPAEIASAEVASAEVMAAASPVAGAGAEGEHTDSALAAEHAAAEAMLATMQGVPKAMAAAATEGAASANDARAIANIVDSVLADLRPKLLEEISKKLAGR